MSNNTPPPPDQTSQFIGILAAIMTIIAAVVARFSKKGDSGDSVRVSALADIIGDMQNKIDDLEDQLRAKDELIGVQDAEIIRLNTKGT